MIPPEDLQAAHTNKMLSVQVRVERTSAFESISIKGLYPCGEGAGFAGGIVSAAVDGMRVGAAVVQQLAGTAAVH